MDKFLQHHLKLMVNGISLIEKGLNELKDNLLVLFGYSGDGLNEAPAITQPQITTTQQPMNGYNNHQKSTLKEIKTMIVELNIKASVRERPDGRFELRSRLLGSIYGFTKEEIEQKLTKRLKEVQKNKGKPLSKKKEAPLLSEFVNAQYLPYKKQTLAESSIGTISTDIRFIVGKGNFDKKLDKYTTANIEMFLFSIPETRKRQIMRGTLNNILGYAKRLGLIKENPCDNVEKVKHKQQIGEALSFQEQLSFFKNLFANPEIELDRKLYLVFLYLTGTRRNEALSVTKKDVDLQNNVLYIRGTKTDGSNRTLPLFPLVRQILTALNPKNGAYFPFTDAIADKIMKKVEGNAHHLHELRHTFGTIKMCVERLDPKTVSLYMGHTTTAMTLSRYTHPEQLDKGVFYNGSMTEDSKLARLKELYRAVLEVISGFISSLTH